MSQVQRQVKAAIDRSVDAVTDASEHVEVAVHAVADGARAAAHQVREATGRVVAVVEEKVERIGHTARDSFNHGRDLGQRYENEFEETVRSRPLISVLVAAGLGLAVGLLWHRRRS